MQHVIITGGIGAGKTKLIDSLMHIPNTAWIVGSPATTMKKLLAKNIARTINHASDGDMGWNHYFGEMMGDSKEKYRLLLIAFGEFFSNLDPFFWIHKVMQEVGAEMSDTRWENDFDYLTGTLYDSIRRPAEIVGIQQVFPDAVRIHLDVSSSRQIQFLMGKGHTVEETIEILSSASEHWLDGVDPDHHVDADQGDTEVLYAVRKILGV